jgi:hypothetical protein
MQVIGVEQYQHDVDQTIKETSLDTVVESYCEYSNKYILSVFLFLSYVQVLALN